MSEEVATLQEDLRRAKEEFARMEEQLRQASSLQQELRTPLNTVLGFAQLLKSSPFGDSEPVEEIYSAANRMAELIDESVAIEWPDANGHPAPEKEPTPAKRPLDDSHAVLCIEDNAANARLIERILAQRSNIKLLFATQGGEGLTQAREQQPELILLDLNLPDMHGSEVLRRLRQDKRTEALPVVVISADATGTQIEKLLSAGARNYLTKPIDVSRFLHTVDEILGTPAGNATPSAVQGAN
jgi:CheY-like chemotaxis protein